MRHEKLSPGGARTPAGAPEDHNYPGANDTAPASPEQGRPAAPDRAAARAERQARERLLRAAWAFNDLEPAEQVLFAERVAIRFADELAPLFAERPHVEDLGLSGFWWTRDDHRRAIVRSWRALPQADRRAFLARVGGAQDG